MTASINQRVIIHVSANCLKIFPMFYKLFTANEWPENFPFYLIELGEWYNENEFIGINLELPTSSIVVSHTRTPHCSSFKSCVQVIRNITVKYTFLKIINSC